jgi:hypothetical protein
MDKLRKSNFNTSLVSEYITACEVLGGHCLDDEFLSHCTTQQLNRVIAMAIEREWWDVVGNVLKVDVRETKIKEVVEVTSKRADDLKLFCCILPHCTDEHLQSALPRLVSRGLWRSVGLVLKRGVSDTQHTWAVEEASKTADVEDFIYYILPRCTGPHLESALPHLVSRRLWKCVRAVLKRDVSTNVSIGSF